MDKWNKKKYRQLQKELVMMKDDKYCEFQHKLIVTKYHILGVRVPQLRKIAKSIHHEDIISYLYYSKDDSYEEVLLQGLIIARIQDIDTSYRHFDQFIRKIDNWAICDICCSSMKIVADNLEYYFPVIKKYTNNPNPFIVRVGIVLLLNYYLNQTNYLSSVFALCDEIQRSEYYINMAIAWLLSICYIKHKDLTTVYLHNNKLSSFVYRKTIQKILESNQVSIEDKKYWQTKKNL